jgi:hypothetical protein
MQWGNMQLVMSHAWGNVYVRIQTSACNTNGGICGWPKIALMHSFGDNATISLTLKGVDCEDKPIESEFSTAGNEIAANYEYRNEGNWHLFKEVQKVVRVEVTFHRGQDYYQLILDNEKNINEILKNGSQMGSNGKTAEEEQKLAEEKKRQEEEKITEEKQKKEEQEKQTEEEKNQQVQNEKQQVEQERKQQYEDSIKAVIYRDSLQAVEQDRTDRLERINKLDNQGKVAFTGIATGVAAVAVGETENNKTVKKILCKAEVSLNYDQLPAYSNTVGREDSYQWSSTDNLSYFGGSGSLYLGYRPLHYLEFYAKPLLTYGTQLADGVTGSYLEYAGIAGIKIGGKVKIGGDVQYGQRTATYEMDGDAVAASAGIYTNDQLITTAEVDHNYLRYGTYLLFETSKNTDSYIQLGAGVERPSYSNKNIMLYKVRFVLGKFLIEGLYAHGYPLDGEPKYNLNENSLKDLLSVKLGVVFNL